MNMKNLSLILCFILVFFTLSTDARRRIKGSREGRNPKSNNGENPEKKFKEAVYRYKKLREEKKAKELEEENNYSSWQNQYQDEDENLQKRQFHMNQDELERANRLLLLGKHDPTSRKIYSIEDGNLIETEYIIETISPNDNDDNSQENDGKMAYKKDTKTVVKTVRRTITKQLSKNKTYTKNRSFPHFPPYVFSNRISKTRVPTTKAVPTTTIRKTTTTIRKTTTSTIKIEATPDNVAVNNAVASGNKSSSSKVYQPKPGTKFQWQLSDCDNVNTKVNADVFDIDLFETPVKKIKELKEKGKKVICYFSGGTVESWRDDAEDYLDKGVVLEEMEDWEDENWVNIKSSKLKPLIQSRLDKAVQKGCDGVEIDNVDGYTFRENNFSYNDQLTFNKWLASEAHKRNLSVGLKNDIDQINDLLPHFDWALNEECYEYGECDHYKPFINANKADRKSVV